MPFLPANYEAPTTTGQYMKFHDGENRFRVLGDAIVGNELWINKKPVRKPNNERFTTDELESADTNEDGTPRKQRHFWAFPVFNYELNQVQVLEITQKTVRETMETYARDADWGEPVEYDFVVSRSGKGIETDYNVIAKPAKLLNEEAAKAWVKVQENGFDLDELFKSGDPFAPSKKTTVRPINEIDISDIPFN